MGALANGRFAEILVDLASLQVAAQPRESLVWLTIGSAAAFLGVSEGALRTWADQGEVPSHRTPGGHRRFLRTELQAMLVASVAGAPDDLEGKALTLIRRRMAGRTRGHGDLFAHLTDTEKVLLREQGRRLVGLAAEYVANPRRRTRLAQEAFEIGTAYGLCLVGHNLPLSQAMDTFVFFRNLVTETAGTSQRAAGTTAGHDAQRVQGLLDQVMRGLVHAYERPRAAGAVALVAQA